MNRVLQQHFLHANDRLKKRKSTFEANVSSPASPIPISNTPSPPPPKKIMKISPKSIPAPVKTEFIPNTSPAPKSELLPELPFTLLSDLQEFDDKLLDDRNLKQALVSLNSTKKNPLNYLIQNFSRNNYLTKLKPNIMLNS